MPSSTKSVFSDPAGYQAALRRDSEFNFTLTSNGTFRAEITRIELHGIRLVTGTEDLARIGFLGVPNHRVRVLLPTLTNGIMVSGGIPSRRDEIATIGSGHALHERTTGPCRWRCIWIPASELRRYGRAIIGTTFSVPHEICRWRPAHDAIRCLSQLHDDAVRMTRIEPFVVVGAESTRGLEQELLAALTECLSASSLVAQTSPMCDNQWIMAALEANIRSHGGKKLSIAEICASLGISQHLLQCCCREYLGMSPSRYLRGHL